MLNGIGKKIFMINTKKTLCLCGFVLSLFVMLACGSKVEEDKLKTEVKKEIVPVDFQYEEVKRIKLDKPEFDNYSITGIVKVFEDKIYLTDRKSFKVLIIDNNGNLLKSFLKKGQGPGEFNMWFLASIRNDTLWIKGDRKVCKFDLNGELLFDKKLNSFYSFLLPVDDDTFFAKKFEKNEEDEKDVSYIIGLFDYKEELLNTYMKSLKNDQFIIKNDKSYFAFSFGGGFKPSMVYNYNFNNNLLYLTKAVDYKINVKNKNNEEKLKIERNVTPFKITEKVKDKVLDDMKQMINTEDGKKQFRKQFPENFAPISSIRFSPNNLVLVKRPNGIDSGIIDVFSKKGKLLGSYNFSEDFDITDGRLYKDQYYKINETDDYYEIIVYKLKNLPKGW